MTKILFALLGASFIVMKIAGIIDWDWIWVLSPIWVYVALWFVMVCVAVAIKREEEKQPPKDARVRSKWEERFEQLQQEQKQKAHIN